MSRQSSTPPPVLRAPAGPPERDKEAPAFEDEITQIVREAIDTSLKGVGISRQPLETTKLMPTLAQIVNKVLTREYHPADFQ